MHGPDEDGFQPARSGAMVASMEIMEWWPKLDQDARRWLIAHNGEAVSPEVLEMIVAVGGSAPRDGESEADGHFLSDEAVDWIEATANHEAG